MQYFLIELRHPGHLKKQIWVKKPRVAALVKFGTTPTTVAWSERLKFYCRVTVIINTTAKANDTADILQTFR